MEPEETIDEAEETMERDLLIRAQKLISNVNWKSLPQDFDEVRLWLIEYDIWAEFVLDGEFEGDADIVEPEPSEEIDENPAGYVDFSNAIPRPPFNKGE